MQSLIQSFTGDKREKHRYAQFTSVLLFFPIDLNAFVLQSFLISNLH